MRIQKTLAFASLIVVPFLTGCGMWRQQTGAVYAPQAYSTPPAYTLPQQQVVAAPQVVQAQPQYIQQPIVLQAQPAPTVQAQYYTQAPAGNACCNPCACQ